MLFFIEGKTGDINYASGVSRDFRVLSPFMGMFFCTLLARMLSLELGYKHTQKLEWSLQKIMKKQEAQNEAQKLLAHVPAKMRGAKSVAILPAEGRGSGRSLCT